MERRGRKEVEGGYTGAGQSLGKSDREKGSDMQTHTETKREGRW